MRLLGFVIDIPEDLAKQLKDRKILAWTGEGLPPDGLSKSIGVKIITNESALMRAVKKLTGLKGDALAVTVDKWKESGTIGLIGWTNVPANGINLTDYLLMPLLRQIGEAFEKNPAKPPKPYRAIHSRVVRDSSLMQPEEINSVVLYRGCFNRRPSGRYETLGAAVVHYYQTILQKNYSSPFAMIGYNSQDVYSDSETGEVYLSDPEISAWLFMNEPPLGSRSEYGEWVQRNALACGSVMPNGKRHVILRPTPNNELYIDASAMLDAGYPVSMEERSRRLYPTGFLWQDADGTWYYLNPLHGLKETKAFAREKMPIAVHCTLREAEFNSFLHILTPDGPKSLIRGPKIRCAVGNFVGSMASGATHANDLVIRVKVERTIRGQIVASMKSKIDGSAMVGKTIPVGKSVIDLDGFMVNRTGHPVILDRKVSIEGGEDENFCTLTAYCHQEFDLGAAKLRGPAKLQYINYKTRGVYAKSHDVELKDGKFANERDEQKWRKWAWDAFPFHLLPDDVKLVVGQEEIKVPDLTFRYLFADTTMQKCVLNEHGKFTDPMLEEQYFKWCDENRKEVTLPIAISAQHCEISHLAGFKPYITYSRSARAFKHLPRLGQIIEAGESIFGVDGAYLANETIEITHVEVRDDVAIVQGRHYWSKETKAKGHWRIDVTSSYIVGDLVFGVESLPVPARGSRTAPTPAMLMSLVMDHNRVHQVKYSKDTLSLMENLTFEEVYAEDIAALFFDAEKNPRLWKDFLKDAAEQWPNGVVLQSPDGSGGIALDFRAIKMFTHGDVTPDDAFGMLAYQSVGLYALLYEYGKKVPDHLLENFPRVAPEEEYKKDYDTFLETFNELTRTMHRCKRAMFALGFSDGMLRRMATPAKVAPFLVAIGSNSIDPGVAFVNEKTAEKYHINEWYFPKVGKDGKEKAKRREGYLLVRFPGDGYAHVTVRVVPWVPDDLLLCSTIDIQMGTKGDSDGDLVMLLSNRDLPAMVHRSRRDREVIVRYLRMMAANRGGVINVRNDERPRKLEEVDWDNNEAQKNPKATQFQRYTRFGELAGTPIVDWMTQKPLWNPNDGKAGTVAVALAQHKIRMEHCSIFNTAGIGMAYNMWHAAVIASCVLYKWSFPYYTIARSAVDIAASIYEDVTLAGGPNEKQWTFYQLLSSPKKDDIEKWYIALENLGFTKIREPIVIPFGVDEEENEIVLETDYCQLLYQLRNFVMGYQALYKRGFVSDFRLGQMGEFAGYVSLAGMMRAFLGYRLKPQWMEKMPTKSTIMSALDVVHEDSPIAMFYWDIVSQLFPMATEVAKTSLFIKSVESEYFS